MKLFRKYYALVVLCMFKNVTFPIDIYNLVKGMYRRQGKQNRRQLFWHSKSKNCMLSHWIWPLLNANQNSLLTINIPVIVVSEGPVVHHFNGARVGTGGIIKGQIPVVAAICSIFVSSHRHVCNYSQGRWTLNFGIGHSLFCLNTHKFYILLNIQLYNKNYTTIHKVYTFCSI